VAFEINHLVVSSVAWANDADSDAGDVPEFQGVLNDGINRVRINRLSQTVLRKRNENKNSHAYKLHDRKASLHS